MSQTPNFDAALDKILADLKPHTRVCTETGESFDITERDIEMYTLLRVPPPTTIWWAELRLQQAYAAGFDLFFREMSDGSHGVSFYDPEAPVTVMSRKVWWSDEFDALRFGEKVDPAESFFEQWRRFAAKIPRASIVQDVKSENSDWVTYSVNYRNGYGCYSGLNNEDIVYSDNCGWCKQSLELGYCGWCEFSYDCLLCMRSSRLRFCERCDECVELAFCFACKNCTDCFGCTNLRHKKFCFLNEQLSEEEYRKRLAAIDLTDARVVADWRERMAKVWSKTYRKGATIIRSEEAVGDDIEDSRDVQGVSIRLSERVYGSRGCYSCRDGARCDGGLDSERIYSTNLSASSSEVKFSAFTDHCLDVEYSNTLAHCEHCFGCLGLRRKKFCIFNKQYAEAEYWPLLDAIKTAMLERGEYGIFFSYADSPFAYNLSYSGMTMPLPIDEVRRLGGRFYQFPDSPDEAESAAAIPERLADVEPTLISRKFRCPITGRNFFFTAPQLALHQELGVAMSRVHPTVNRMRRAKISSVTRLYSRACVSCDKQIDTRIPPEHTAPVLCGACYEQVVIGEKAEPTNIANRP